MTDGVFKMESLNGSAIDKVVSAIGGNAGKNAAELGAGRHRHPIASCSCRYAVSSGATLEFSGDHTSGALQDEQTP